jgi:acyl-coenzyme A synthetase/AMP-(fatty) acid ligase
MSAGTSIPAAWEAVVRRARARAAVIGLVDGGETSFHSLHQLARDRAAALDAAPGRALALALTNQPEWMAWFLAARMRGHCLIPLDPSQPVAAREATARRLGASWRVDAGGCTPLSRPVRPLRWKGKACLKLTSGTTGDPTPVPNEDRHLLADGQQVAASMGLRSSDRNLALIPLGHSYALGNIVMPLILQGMAMGVAPAFLPPQLAAWIARHRLTVFPTVPAVLQALVALPSATTLAGLRLVISAGAPLAPALAAAFHQKFGLIPHNFYGSSETGGICYDRSGRASLKGSSTGTPLQGVTLALSGRGRVRVSSAAVAHPSGYFLLRDLGQLRPDGSLLLLGRSGAVANIGGKKVAPREIEIILRSLVGVTDAACWVKAAHGRHYLVAAAEGSAPPQVLRRELAERLPAWKIPRELHVLPAFPRTNRGKTDLNALQAALPPIPSMR